MRLILIHATYLLGLCVLILIYFFSNLLAEDEGLDNRVTLIENSASFSPNYHQLNHIVFGINLTIKPKLDFLIENNGLPSLILIVTSAINNYNLREAIRNTWGKWINNHNQRLYFLVGKAEIDEDGQLITDDGTDNATIPRKLKDEINDHQDIIQYDFIDNYHNLTLKSLLMLRYFNEEVLNLSTAEFHTPKLFQQNYNSNYSFRYTKSQISFKPIFLFKSDDDVFVHVPNLMNLLIRLVKYYSKIKSQKPNQKEVSFRLLMGYLIRGAKPFRNPSSKYYVPNSVYSEAEYPNYLSGAAYLLSADVARSIMMTALFTNRCPYLYFEDIFLTGICASKAIYLKNDYKFNLESMKSGFKVVNNSGFKYSKVDPKKYICFYKSPAIMAGHRLNSTELYYVWNQIFLSFTNTSKVDCYTSQKMFKRHRKLR